GLARCELTVAAAQLMRMRCEPDLRVVQRPVVGSRRAARVPAHAADCVRELALAGLDGRDAFRQLRSEPTQLLLGGDADRVQAFLLALDRDRLVLLPTEEGH